MEDKQIKKIKRYLEDVIDSRDDLLQSTEKLITSATLQVQSLLTTPISLLQRETLLKYLTKAVVLFVELNHSVTTFLETEQLPNISDNPQACKGSQRREQSPPVQDLHDFFKPNSNESISTFDFSTTGPKILNSNVLNESYIRKPLDNTTLKAICVANSNNPENIWSQGDCPPTVAVKVVENNDVDHVKQVVNTPLIKQEHHETKAHISPTFSLLSESEVFSSGSSVAYQHPLSKFHPSNEVPRQYDTHDLDQIKENLVYLSKKMGFDSEKLNQIQCQFNKSIPKADSEYEDSFKEVQKEVENKTEEVLEVAISEEKDIEPVVTLTSTTNELSTSEGTDACPSKNVQLNNLNNNVEISEDNKVILNNESVEAGPSKSTGAIRKQQIKEDLMEFSSVTSDSDGCEKVNTWLNNNEVSREKLLDFTESTTTSEELSIKRNSAIEKLHSVKRYDRNEEAREQARSNMPDIKFVPVEVPSVIKNDLNLDSSSTERISNGKKEKVKDFNVTENGVYELKKMDTPEVGAVCMFSHIESPDEFYIQTLSDISTAYFDEINTKLEEKFRKTSSFFKTKQDAFENLGKFCSGYILGDKEAWYRLQILDWELGCPSPDVKVKSVDYGFTCRTSYKYLRKLSKDLIDIPMLAIQCYFPLIYPPGSTYSNKLTEWPQETIDSFHEMVNLHSIHECSDFKMFEITLAVLEGESLAVDMALYGEPSADSLRNMLLDFGLATELIEDYGEHPELGEFFEDIDELERPENLNELVLSYDAKDEMRICKFTRGDGTCFKGKHCKLEHIPLKDGYTTDKTIVFYTATNDLIFPIMGETVQILVMGYVDSCTYLVQIVRNPVKKENSNLVMDRDIMDLMDAMNHPKKVSKYERFKAYPSVGEVILAYFPPTKMWLRVVVRELKYDKNGDLMAIEVYAVDFGDHFTVKFKDIRVMLEEFMHVPFQVVQIYLDNYQHRIGCDSKKAKRFIQQHISYRNFLAHIISSQAPFKASVTTLKGKDIGPTLVKSGFAEKRTMDIWLAEGHKIDLY